MAARDTIKVPVALPQWLVAEIDEWRGGTLKQSRAQAIRSLLRVALDREKRLRKKRKETVEKRLGRGLAEIPATTPAFDWDVLPTLRPCGHPIGVACSCE